MNDSQKGKDFRFWRERRKQREDSGVRVTWRIINESAEEEVHDGDCKASHQERRTRRERETKQKNSSEKKRRREEEKKKKWRNWKKGLYS